MALYIFGAMLEIELSSLFLRMPHVGQIHISAQGIYFDPWSRARHG